MDKIMSDIQDGRPEDSNYDNRAHVYMLSLETKLAELKRRIITEPNSVTIPEEDAHRLNELYCAAARMCHINSSPAPWEEHYGAVVDAVYHLDGGSTKSAIIPIEAGSEK